MKYNKPMSKSTEYKGVSWNRNMGMWRVQLTSKGVKYLDTHAQTAKEGAIMRDTAILKHQLKINTQILKPYACKEKPYVCEL